MELALHALHEALGAAMEERDGWTVPARYGDVADEHAAVRGSVGMIDLSDLGVVRMTGKDAASVLNGVLSNDTRLQPGRGCSAVLLNDKGRIRTVLHLLRTEDELLLLVAPGQGETVREAIDYYIFTEDATVEDVSAQWAVLSLQGPSSPRVEGPELSHEVREIAGVDVRVARHSRTGEDGVDLWVPRDAAGRVWSELLDVARPVGRDALEVLRVEAGIPRLGSEMGEDYNPLETGLLGAIDYEKGCYLGQEVIARITFLSKPVKRLVGILADAPLSPGDRPVFNDKEVGKVTSVVHSISLGRPIAMGYVKNEVIRQGPTLRIGEMEATVQELPFYRRDLGYEPADQVRPPMEEGKKPALPF